MGKRSALLNLDILVVRKSDKLDRAKQELKSFQAGGKSVMGWGRGFYICCAYDEVWHVAVLWVAHIVGA